MQEIGESTNLVWAIVAAVILLIAVSLVLLRRKRGPRIPDALRPGRSLPDFAAADEHGNPIRSTRVVGSPTVMLFVRGNWCPFCSSQVKDLTTHYKDIVDLGAKLIFVTPKPLETTRRVAEFFEVEFDFWLDDHLEAASQLGLVMTGGVPGDHQKEYGDDTVWPTALVIDAAGIIRYSKLSRMAIDRPDPKVLLDELRKLQN
jgi:peroxiredoxin